MLWASWARLRAQALGPSLPFQLFLQLVEEPPVRALAEDLLRARLDHPRFVKAERVEAQRVLVILRAPQVVRELLDQLKRVVVLARVALSDDGLRGNGWGRRAEGGRLEDGSQGSLCRPRGSGHEVTVRLRHAREGL